MAAVLEDNEDKHTYIGRNFEVKKLIPPSMTTAKWQQDTKRHVREYFKIW